MSSFGTSLSEAFGVVETLENQDKNSGVQKLEHEQKHMNKVCSKKCLSVYESGNPSKEDISQFCSPGCVTTSTKFRKNMVPDGLRNNPDAHATETALKESFATIEGMHHRHPRPGPPHHGPMRPHGHHGDRRVEIIQEMVSTNVLRNIRKNLDLVLLLVVLVILLVVGLVVMRK
uniref:Uncharacterized protein n=1 Tax=viral metagenome TaxID=1070528 RepID=A0A6C0J9X3_9ZZZZ